MRSRDEAIDARGEWTRVVMATVNSFSTFGASLCPLAVD